MTEFKRMELTSNDVISESAKSLADLIIEARKTALKENIKANTVLIDKTFAKVNDIHFVVGRDILHIPPMICGLEVHLTDELPDGYDFALVEAPETERERIVRQAKSEAAKEIFEEIEKVIGKKYNYYVFGNNDLDSIEKDAIINFSDSLSESFAELKKKYTEDNDVAYGGPREGGKRFAEKRDLLYQLKHEVHEKAVRPHNAGIDAYITLKVFDAILQSALNKYTEGEK